MCKTSGKQQKTRDLFRKIGNSNFSPKHGHKNYRNSTDLVDAEEIKMRRNEYPKNCTKKILMNQITMVEWSVAQSQTSWSVKSSGPQEAPLLIKLAGMTKFQQSYTKP